MVPNLRWLVSRDYCPVGHCPNGHTIARDRRNSVFLDLNAVSSKPNERTSVSGAGEVKARRL